MVLPELEYRQWLLVAALAAFELMAVVFLIYLARLRRRRLLKGASPLSLEIALRGDPQRVSCEIDRLCSGEDPNGDLIKRMTPADRALFEVSIIDALNNRSREGQHRLRSALIKCGYDELCARRVMSPDLSDRVRATSLLNLLRPQWRDNSKDTDSVN